MKSNDAWRIVPLALALVLFAASAAAQTPEAAPAAFDVEAATEAYVSTLSGEARERSDAYFEGGYWLILWNTLVVVAVAWLVLARGWSARMRDLGERVTAKRFVHTFLYAAQYLALAAVLSFPFIVYRDFFREHEYGLSNQTFVEWFLEFLIGQGVSIIAVGILFMLIYAVIRRAGRTWWLWASGVSALFICFMIFISPVFIEPLFNEYKPLDQGPVKTELLAMTRANGVVVDQIFQVDSSKQSKRIGANVAGFMGTMRVALNDNLLERTSLLEIRVVLAHELGHYVLKQIYQLVIYLTVIITLSLAIIDWAFDRVVARWGGGWNLRGLADVAGLPVILALFAVISLALTPVHNNYIRAYESAADIFALNASREPDGFAKVAMRLSEYRKIDPGPFEEWFFYDHPSGRSRILMAMRWKAENLD